MSAPIIITIPKYVTVPKQNLLPLPSAEDSMDEFLLRGKKRCLDHLSWDEKFQRKKLKNRVAAQTSTDRKKAKMDDMEQTIKDISDENISLKETCCFLQSERDELASRNEELERQMEELKQRLNERSVGSGTTTNGSSESKPLLQELDSQSILRTINKSENSNGAKNIDDSLNTPTKKRVHIKIESKHEDISMDLENNSNDDDTLYGTYDEKTHCITILVSGDDIATDEAVEDITITSTITLFSS